MVSDGYYYGLAMIGAAVLLVLAGWWPWWALPGVPAGYSSSCGFSAIRRVLFRTQPERWSLPAMAKSPKWRPLCTNGVSAHQNQYFSERVRCPCKPIAGSGVIREVRYQKGKYSMR